MKATTFALVALALALPACHRASRPETIATTDAQVSNMVMDDQALYYLKRGNAAKGAPSYDGAVFTIPKGGGAPKALASGLFLADHIAVDAASVYYSHSKHDAGKVHNILSRVAKSGAAPADMVDGDRSIEALAVDGTAVFFAAGQAGGRIMKLDKAGGVPVELAASQSNPRGMVLDADSVYWISIEASGRTIRKVAKSGGATTDLASAGAPTADEHLGIDATGVYYRDGARLMSVPKAGGAPAQVTDHVAEFAVDGETVYFTQTNDIYLMKLSRTDPKPSAVAYDPGAFPSGISFDATSVYWSSPSDQQIRRAKK